MTRHETRREDRGGLRWGASWLAWLVVLVTYGWLPLLLSFVVLRGWDPGMTEFSLFLISSTLPAVGALSGVGFAAWGVLVGSVANLMRAGRFRVWWVGALVGLMPSLLGIAFVLVSDRVVWLEGWVGASRVLDGPAWLAGLAGGPMQVLTLFVVVSVLLASIVPVAWLVVRARRDEVERRADVTAIVVASVVLVVSLIDAAAKAA